MEISTIMFLCGDQREVFQTVNTIAWAWFSCQMYLSKYGEMLLKSVELFPWKTSMHDLARALVFIMYQPGSLSCPRAAC